MSGDSRAIDAPRVAATLERILASPLFVQAERQRRLLRYVVEESVAGRAGRLSQYTLGIDVFDRGSDFDPTIDSAVRVEVGRLRAKLREYYEAVPEEAVVIRIPKGRYVADFDIPDGDDAAGPPPSAPATNRPTVAVMPFAPVSNEADDRYFADGFTEDLITDLSKIVGLRIIARQSSFKYRDTEFAAPDIGRELGATHLLEGSVRRAGARLRINAQLVDCKSGEHLWAERYDRDLADIFSVQDEVGRRIVAALSVALTAADRYRRPGAETTSMEAYDAVLRASALSWSLDDVFEACRLYDHALSLDAGYAAAYARRANLTWYLWRGGWADDGALSEARGIAERGIEADPEHGEAHAVLGFIAFWQGEFDVSETHFHHAISRDPVNVRIFERHAICRTTLGFSTEARDLIKRAQALNPHEPYFFPRGAIAFAEADLDEALHCLRGSAERFDSFLPTRIYLSAVLALRDERQAAVTEVAAIRTINPALSFSRLKAGWPPPETGDCMRRFHQGFKRAWEWSTESTPG